MSYFVRQLNPQSLVDSSYIPYCIQPLLSLLYVQYILSCNCFSIGEALFSIDVIINYHSCVKCERVWTLIVHPF